MLIVVLFGIYSNGICMDLNERIESAEPLRPQNLISEGDSNLQTAANGDLQLTGRLEFDLPGINYSGSQLANEIVNGSLKLLTNSQQAEIVHNMINGNYTPHTTSLKWWHFVSAIAHPIGGLAMMLNSVLPLLSFGIDSPKFSTVLKITISVSGVISLAFEKICKYADDRILEQTRELIILQAAKEREASV